MFITFEGCEGVGKSTQVKLLKETLEKKGAKVFITREPGGTELAEKLRQLLFENVEIKDPLTEYLIITAARHDHIEKFVKPHLLKGFIIICDRFYDSSIAYQGYAKGLEINKMKAIYELVLGSFKPNITFLIDIDPKIALKRIKTKRLHKNHYDEKEVNFHVKVRNGFLQIAKENQDRICVINGLQSIRKIHNNIYTKLLEKL